jgi:hypothetical protein
MSFSSRFSEIKFNLSSVLLLDSFIELIRVRVFHKRGHQKFSQRGFSIRANSVEYCIGFVRIIIL